VLPGSNRPRVRGLPQRKIGSLIIGSARYFALYHYQIIGSVDTHVIEVELALVTKPTVDSMPTGIVRIAIGVMNFAVVFQRQGHLDVSRKGSFGVKSKDIGISARTGKFIRRA
jgi:hypothetical protein